MHNTQLLDWDSNVLGVSVAKILTATLTPEKLTSLLHMLKSKGVKLVYWLIANEDVTSQKAAQHCGGLLTDEKVTYHLDLKTLLPFYIDKEIAIYTADTANAELEAISVEISKFSRFSHDPHLTISQVNKLYKTWIDNACKKIVAKTVLVIKDQYAIVGMVTIDDKKGRADLSLLGVDPQHQGKGLGKRLVQAAQAWSIVNNYTLSQVVTQKSNYKARRLYESCGYQQKKTEKFYHFWV
ncbi:MAG: GNAT family N-acetyltransferase [Rickettsiella sp.]|nr:GNAT family N-acetyltransferase [Rickettsiella sp.]